MSKKSNISYRNVELIFCYVLILRFVFWSLTESDHGFWEATRGLLTSEKYLHLRRKDYLADHREIIMANDSETECREVLQNVNNLAGNFMIITTSEGLQTAIPSGSYEAERELNSTSFCEGEDGLQNEEEILEDGVPHQPKKRGHYTRYSHQDKEEIGKIAAESGNVISLRKFQTIYPTLSESTVRHFKGIYLRELKKKKASKPVSKAKRRGQYIVYSGEERASIGKCAYEMGNSTALKQFKTELPRLSESTVRGFKCAYAKELVKAAEENLCAEETSCATRMITGDDAVSEMVEKAGDISSLPRGKRGRPGKIPNSMIVTILSYLKAIAAKETRVTPKAAIAIAKGVIMTENRSVKQMDI